jgi:alpha-glucosidase
MLSSSLPWWKREAIYQIFVPSFRDGNGDGIGDLLGVLSRIDHLDQLGVGAVWLTPIYPTPFLDAGYDIADFAGIGAQFGDLATFDRLVAALHARGIRVLLDFVPNHSASEHPWFRESRSSRTSAKRDWYVWRDPAADGGPPNNWLSRFGGSAWTLDPTTGQYYYHAFLPEQPDLNWRAPALIEAMHAAMRFWLDRGVDGFRIDAAAVLVEDEGLRDEPDNPDFDGDTPPPERYRRIYTDSQAECLVHLAGFRTVVDAYAERVLLGEVDTTPDKIAGFYGDARHPRLHLPLNYRLVDTTWKAQALTTTIDDYLRCLPPGAWPDWVLGSHDKPRVATRLGPDQARVAALLLLTLPGTPIIYAGDEIGLPDVSVPPERSRDPFEARVPGYGLSRDPFRTPMRWDETPGGDFGSDEPWLPLGPVPTGCNVAHQAADPSSLLNLYRRLLALRRHEPALQRGAYRHRLAEGGVLCFERAFGEERLIVALNLSASARTIEGVEPGRILISTRDRDSDETVSARLALAPHEALILRPRAR